MGSEINLGATLITKKFRQIKIGTELFDPLGGYDLWETRGLWIWAKPKAVELSGEFNTDDRKNWKVTPKASIRKYDNKGSEYLIDFQSIINAGTRVSFRQTSKAAGRIIKLPGHRMKHLCRMMPAGRSAICRHLLIILTSLNLQLSMTKGRLTNILADVKEYKPDNIMCRYLEPATQDHWILP